MMTEQQIYKLTSMSTIRFNLGESPWTEAGFRCAVLGAEEDSPLLVIAGEARDLGIPFVLFDPTGRYRGRQWPGAERVTAAENAGWVWTALTRLRSPAGLLIDLSGLSATEQQAGYAEFARRFLAERQQQKQPRRAIFLLDEVQIFAPRKGLPAAAKALALTLEIAKTGQVSGVELVIASTKPGDLATGMLANMNVALIGPMAAASDLEAVEDYLGGPVEAPDLQDLRIGEFYLVADLFLPATLLSRAQKKETMFDFELAGAQQIAKQIVGWAKLATENPRADIRQIIRAATEVAAEQFSAEESQRAYLLEQNRRFELCMRRIVEYLEARVAKPGLSVSLVTNTGLTAQEEEFFDTFYRQRLREAGGARDAAEELALARDLKVGRQQRADANAEWPGGICAARLKKKGTVIYAHRKYQCNYPNRIHLQPNPTQQPSLSFHPENTDREILYPGT